MLKQNASQQTNQMNIFFVRSIQLRRLNKSSILI